VTVKTTGLVWIVVRHGHESEENVMAFLTEKEAKAFAKTVKPELPYFPWVKVEKCKLGSTS
jgi:hypothetical protein